MRIPAFPELVNVAILMVAAMRVNGNQTNATAGAPSSPMMARSTRENGRQTRCMVRLLGYVYFTANVF
jgi:hypothetical protein